MEIKSEKLRLYTPGPGDLPRVKAIWTDPATMREVGGVVDWPEEKLAGWLAGLAGGGQCYFLAEDTAGRCVGEVSFHAFKAAEGTARFNVKILASLRGRGYGREAMLLALDHFFRAWGGREMLDDIAPDNYGSHRLFLAFGFERLPERTDAFWVRMTRERFYALYGDRFK